MSYAKRAMNFGMARIKPKLVQTGNVWVFTMGGDFTTPFDLLLKGQSEPGDFILQETYHFRTSIENEKKAIFLYSVFIKVSR